MKHKRYKGKTLEIDCKSWVFLSNKDSSVPFYSEQSGRGPGREPLPNSHFLGQRFWVGTDSFPNPVWLHQLHPVFFITWSRHASRFSLRNKQILRKMAIQDVYSIHNISEHWLKYPYMQTKVSINNIDKVWWHVWCYFPISFCTTGKWRTLPKLLFIHLY